MADIRGLQHAPFKNERPPPLIVPFRPIKPLAGLEARRLAAIKGRSAATATTTT